MEKRQERAYDRERMNAVAIEVQEQIRENHVMFQFEGDRETKVFHGKFLEKWAELSGENGFRLLVGAGDAGKESGKVREICACAAKEMGKRGIENFSCDIKPLVAAWGGKS